MWVIIVANTLVFGATAWTCEGASGEVLGRCDALVRFGGLELTRVWIEREWWRVATAPWLHGSTLHLAVNMWSLWVLFPWAQRGWGQARATAVFLVSACAGGLASLAWAEGGLVVGASGGLMGLAGGCWVAARRGVGSGGRWSGLSSTSLGVAIAVMLGIGAVVPGIAQAGHCGGLLAGSALIFSARGGWLRRGLSGVGVLGLGVGLVLLADRPVAAGRWSLLMGYGWLDRAQPGRAVEALETALRIQGENRPDPVLWNAIAFARAESDRDLPRAERLARRALARVPTDSDTLDTLGWALCRGGRSEEGRQVLAWAKSASTDPLAVEEVERHVATCQDGHRSAASQ